MMHMSFARWSTTAGTGLAVLFLLAMGLAALGGQGETLGPPLVEPTVISARRGVVELTLGAAPSLIPYCLVS